jgi:hypothetical protein
MAIDPNIEETRNRLNTAAAGGTGGAGLVRVITFF